MISDLAIEEFLEEKVEDWGFVKKLEEVDALEMIEKITGLEYQSLFKTYPYRHQLLSFLLGLYNFDFMFFLKMGLGKTKVTLDLFNYYKKIGAANKMLFVVLNVVSVTNIAREVKKHSNLSYCTLSGTKDQREEMLESDADIFIINYQGLPVLLCDRKVVKVEVKQCAEAFYLLKKGGIGFDTVKDNIVVPVKGVKYLKKIQERFENYNGSIKYKKKEYVSNDKIDKLKQLFDFYCFDEVHTCGNKHSNTYKICQKLSKDCEFVYGLTGTPFGRDPMKLFSQFYLVDQGKALGTSLTMFRQLFFEEYQITFEGTGGYEVEVPGAIGYKLDKEKEHILNARIKSRSIRFLKRECYDLPDKKNIIVPVVMPYENRLMYDKAIEGILEAKGDYRILQNSFTRSRQITSGFYVFKNSEGERIEHEFKENPKLDMLMELISSVSDESKLIIFHWFIPSGRMISERLKKEKYNYVWLYGQSKNKGKEFEKFLDDKECRVLLANIKTGSHSLNPQEVANYTFYYETPTGPDVREQADDRTNRPGQTKKTFFYDIVIKNTIDETILQSIKDGEDIIKRLLGAGPKQRKKLLGVK